MGVLLACDHCPYSTYMAILPCGLLEVRWLISIGWLNTDRVTNNSYSLGECNNDTASNITLSRSMIAGNCTCSKVVLRKDGVFAI
jgi:hypothetical protein